MATNIPTRSLRGSGEPPVLGEHNGATIETHKQHVNASLKTGNDNAKAAESNEVHNRIRNTQAWIIPDLLDAIFGYLGDDEKALRYCALVCRAWTELALDHLWADMKTVVPLLQLIVPMKVNPSQQGIWWFNGSLDISKNTWDRFRQYAMRVRSLTCDDNGSRKRLATSNLHLSSVVLSGDLIRIASECPFEDGFLPNCQSIVWVPNHKDAAGGLVALLHSSLSKLEIGLAQGGNAKFLHVLPPFRQIIVSDAKNIKTIVLNTVEIVAKYQDSLVQCLEHLTSLEEVVLPPWFQTSAIVKAAAELPGLKTFGVQWKAPFDRYRPSYGMKFTFPENGFRSLNCLGVTMELGDLSQVLEDATTPVASLTRLTVWDRNYNDADAIRRFLDIIPTVFPNLEEASLVLFGENPESNNIPMTFDTLRPLLRCNSIKDLYMGHDVALVIASYDVQEMAAAWPNLRTLDLCKDPYTRALVDPPNHSPQGLGLHSLLYTPFEIVKAFARCIPKLRDLGLHFSTQPEPDFDGNFWRPPWFKANLRVGTSVVPKDEAITAFYLASLFHDEVEFNCNASVWRDEFIAANRNYEDFDNNNSEDGKEEYDRIRKWKSVSRIVKQAHCSRQLLLKSSNA